MIDINELNSMQREAATSFNGAQLILAGAGSGKTRTITYRIAKLVENGVSPHSILAITFTNKAANEMKERIATLVPGGAGMWVGTFHSICVRILRRDAHLLDGYTSSFTIYDADDQRKLIVSIMKEMKIDERFLEPREALNIIGKFKDKLISPSEALTKIPPDQKQMAAVRIYAAYEKRLHEANAMDFDDLIIKTLELFATCPDVLAGYSARFQYVHVDEYQDTNFMQYNLISLLCKHHGNICVVGDDDQSIYAWRGADIRNILEFEKDYPNAMVIRLEQNYRSDGHILNAANAVIKNNASRMGKQLWTERDEGEKVALVSVSSERDEADFVCSEIKKLLKDGFTRKDIAILYRINAQSRSMENALSRSAIPYRIYGGLKFFERMEIKDALAWLRVIENPNDEISLMRAVGAPRRGIGPGALDGWREYAAQTGRGLFQALMDIEVSGLPQRAIQALSGFAAVIRSLLTKRDSMLLPEFVKTALEESGLAAQYKNKDDSDSRDRLENLNEFLSAATEFRSADGEATLSAFLDGVALSSDTDALNSEHMAVTLMTLHSAKGLEYPVVFIIGAEEGLLPHSRAFYSQTDLEEERRLCYVGITRAMRKIYIIHAKERMLFGNTRNGVPSRFLAELPEGSIMNYDPSISARSALRTPQRTTVKRAVPERKSAPIGLPIRAAEPAQAREWKTGARVSHSVFGDGMVVSVNGEGSKAVLTVAFDGQGVKKLSASIAPLKPLD